MSSSRPLSRWRQRENSSPRERTSRALWPQRMLMGLGEGGLVLLSHHHREAVVGQPGKSLPQAPWGG